MKLDNTKHHITQIIDRIDLCDAIVSASIRASALSDLAFDQHEAARHGLTPAQATTAARRASAEARQCLSAMLTSEQEA